jgi:hypothetical protein
MEVTLLVRRNGDDEDLGFTRAIHDAEWKALDPHGPRIAESLLPGGHGALTVIDAMKPPRVR